MLPASERLAWIPLSIQSLRLAWIPLSIQSLRWYYYCFAILKKKKKKKRHINMILSHNTAWKWSKTYESTYNFQKSFASEQNVSHKLWPGTSGSPHTYFVQFTLWQQNPVSITIFVRFTALCPLCLQHPKFLATLHEHIQAFDPFSSSWAVAFLELGAGVIVLHNDGEQKL